MVWCAVRGEIRDGGSIRNRWRSGTRSRRSSRRSASCDSRAAPSMGGTGRCPASCMARAEALPEAEGTSRDRHPDRGTATPRHAHDRAHAVRLGRCEHESSRHAAQPPGGELDEAALGMGRLRATRYSRCSAGVPRDRCARRHHDGRRPVHQPGRVASSAGGVRARGKVLRSPARRSSWSSSRHHELPDAHGAAFEDPPPCFGSGSAPRAPRPQFATFMLDFEHVGAASSASDLRQPARLARYRVRPDRAGRSTAPSPP